MAKAKKALRYSISNIAWPSSADADALKLVAELGFCGVEIAPSKVFGSLDTVSEETVLLYRNKLSKLGLEIPAMQAILFGVSDARLFGTLAEEQKLFERLSHIAKLSQWLEARFCVFGAPTLRDPGALEAREAMLVAQRFFHSVASKFADSRCTLCFEANPEIYNNRFVTHTAQALELVTAVGSSGFGLQFDAGTFFANQEINEVDRNLISKASHFHVSEPYLVPVGSSNVAHSSLGDLLLNSDYDGWVSLEMKAVDDWEHAIRRANQILVESYGKEPN